MAKDYPGRQRARKAFGRGVKSLRHKVPFNPYRHSRLRALFDCGREEALLKPALVQLVPVKGNRPSRQEVKTQAPVPAATTAIAADDLPVECRAPRIQQCILRPLQGSASLVSRMGPVLEQRSRAIEQTKRPASLPRIAWPIRRVAGSSAIP